MNGRYDMVLQLWPCPLWWPCCWRSSGRRKPAKADLGLRPRSAMFSPAIWAGRKYGCLEPTCRCHRSLRPRRKLGTGWLCVDRYSDDSYRSRVSAHGNPLSYTRGPGHRCRRSGQPLPLPCPKGRDGASLRRWSGRRGIRVVRCRHSAQQTRVAGLVSA
jgi:hypothetical protein